METTMEKNTLNQERPENTSTTSGNIPENSPAGKWNLGDARLKELLSKEEVREAIELYVNVPKEGFIKKARNPFENKETKEKTQKVEVMSGTTLEDAVTFEITLLNTEIDPIQAINKKFRIIDYAFAFEANMNGGKFAGYAPTGLRLIVTRLEEVR